MAGLQAGGGLDSPTREIDFLDAGPDQHHSRDL